MFDIFIKRKKIVLDCFTHKDYVYDFAKINYAAKYYPDWWKKTENFVPGRDDDGSIKDFPTIRYCSAFTSLYNKGIVIPSWFSLEMNVGNNRDKRYTWRTSINDFAPRGHSNSQYSNFCLDNGFNFKIVSPWHFRTKKKINFIWSQPTWNMRDNLCKYTILPGVVQFRNQFATEINLFITYENDAKIINIDPLVPLVMLHPMTEHKVEIRNHLVSEQKFYSMVGVKKMMFYNDVNTSAKMMKFRKTREKIIDMANDD